MSREQKRTPKKEWKDLTFRDLTSAEVIRRAAYYKRKIIEAERDLMQRIIDQDRLTEDDYRIVINARAY